MSEPECRRLYLSLITCNRSACGYMPIAVAAVSLSFVWIGCCYSHASVFLAQEPADSCCWNSEAASKLPCESCLTPHTDCGSEIMRLSEITQISKLHVSVTLGATWETSVWLHAQMPMQVAPEIGKSRAGTTFSNRCGSAKAALHQFEQRDCPQ